MHVTLVGGFDPTQHRVGGTRSYVDNLARVMERQGVPHLVVTAAHDSKEGPNSYAIRLRHSGSTAHLLAALAAQVKDLPIPSDSLIHAQRPDHLVPFGIANVGGRWICTLHGDSRRAVTERNSRLVAGFDAVAEMLVLRRVARAVAVDDGTRATYVSRYPWLENRLEVIPNGVDMAEYRPLDKEKCRREWDFKGPVLLYAGRLEPEKRVGTILDAFGAVGNPRAVFAVAGEGRDKLSLLRGRGDPRIRFLGAVDRSRMVSLLNAADALVMFSAREGVPSVALEALACGVPVISTPVGELSKLIHPGVNGFFVGSQEELTDAMRSVLDNGLSTQDSIVESAHPYEWQGLGRRWLELYRRVVV